MNMQMLTLWIILWKNDRKSTFLSIENSYEKSPKIIHISCFLQNARSNKMQMDNLNITIYSYIYFHLYAFLQNGSYANGHIQIEMHFL